MRIYGLLIITLFSLLALPGRTVAAEAAFPGRIDLTDLLQDPGPDLYAAEDSLIVGANGTVLHLREPEATDAKSARFVSFSGWGNTTFWPNGVWEREDPPTDEDLRGLATGLYQTYIGGDNGVVLARSTGDPKYDGQAVEGVYISFSPEVTGISGDVLDVVYTMSNTPSLLDEYYFFHWTDGERGRLNVLAGANWFELALPGSVTSLAESYEGLPIECILDGNKVYRVRLPLPQEGQAPGPPGGEVIFTAPQGVRLTQLYDDLILGWDEASSVYRAFTIADDETVTEVAAPTTDPAEGPVLELSESRYSYLLRTAEAIHRYLPGKASRPLALDASPILQMDAEFFLGKDGLLIDSYAYDVFAYALDGDTSATSGGVPIQLVDTNFTEDRFGEADKALLLDPTLQSMAVIPVHPMLRYGHIDLAFRADATEGEQALVTYDGTCDGDLLYLGLSDGHLVVEMRHGPCYGDHVAVSLRSEETVSVGEWHRASVYFGFGDMEVELDGKTLTRNDPGHIDDFALQAASDAAPGILIGAHPTLGRHFQGAVDEIVVAPNDRPAHDIVRGDVLFNGIPITALVFVNGRTPGQSFSSHFYLYQKPDALGLYHVEVYATGLLPYVEDIRPNFYDRRKNLILPINMQLPGDAPAPDVDWSYDPSNRRVEGVVSYGGEPLSAITLNAGMYAHTDENGGFTRYFLPINIFGWNESATKLFIFAEGFRPVTIVQPAPWTGW